MKMKYTEQAVETLDDAGSVIANKNIEIEQLRQRVAELEKERDKEIARNRPLHNLIVSLEEQKSHWKKKRNKNREAVSTLDSEREANALLTAERDALKQQRDELLAALEELSLYVAYNGDDWVQKKAKAAIASIKEKQNGSRD